MPDDLAVRLAAISARLKEAGEGGLRRRLADAISKAVEPVEKEIRAGLRPHLPDRYADLIAADLEVSRSMSVTATAARVTVQARTAGPSKRKLRRLDQGILWHPLFGRFPRRDPRNKWFEMGEPHVKPGWFSGPVQDVTPDVREAVIRAVDDAARDLARQ